MKYNTAPQPLLPPVPLPRLRQAERRIEVLEAKQRDLELQRDEFLRFVLKSRTALRGGRAVTAADVDTIMAYCEEFTAAERAEETPIDFDIEKGGPTPAQGKES